MISESKVNFARKYTAVRYILGLFKPGKYTLVPPFGDLSEETIQYLVDNNVLGLDRRPTKKMRGNKSSKFIISIHGSNDHLDTQERAFATKYVKSRELLNKKFGYVAPEDVLQYMRTGRLTQTMSFPSQKERHQVVESFEQQYGELSTEDVESTWQEISGQNT